MLELAVFEAETDVEVTGIKTEVAVNDVERGEEAPDAVETDNTGATWIADAAEAEEELLWTELEIATEMRLANGGATSDVAAVVGGSM